ncbi:hypothetical protein K7432_000850 [Basidiobolus ranarum]|uniref:Uncharacterized protein n=1 Tax=Basidiobolus ranarum TaxID=34480 RepID=A0ABR2WAJ8_9FUNG
MRNRRRVHSSQRFSPFLSLTRTLVQDSSRNSEKSLLPPSTFNANPYHTTPSDTSSSQGEQTISQEAGPVDAENSPLEICRLRIDNSYLLEQNRALSRELAQAKLTAHALRQIIVKKENEVTKLRQENRRLILKKPSFGNELTSELTLTRSTQPQLKFFKEENASSKETSN